MNLGWFSCGITSAVACKLAIEKYGDVKLYYIEIASAHPDNERFITECEKWYGQEIIRIKNSKGYTDQFDVIEKTGYVNGAAGARCTVELKKEVRYQLEKSLTANLFALTDGIKHQIFGFEFSRLLKLQ